MASQPIAHETGYHFVANLLLGFFIQPQFTFPRPAWVVPQLYGKRRALFFAIPVIEAHHWLAGDDEV
jgi:hypothetical protein